MDFILLASLVGVSVVWLALSYDIACQWSVHFLERIHRYPAWMQLPLNLIFTFGIPKFHLPAHGISCQSPFSWNFRRGSARTDFEAPERGWSHINPLQFATREMAPGHRSDTLDVHWSSWNWRKIRNHGMYPSFLRSLVS
jgi:hypothetical protein